MTVRARPSAEQGPPCAESRRVSTKDPPEILENEGHVARFRADAARSGDRSDDPLHDVREQRGHPRNARANSAAASPALHRFVVGGVFEGLSAWGAALLVSCCLWPLFVHRMRRVAGAGGPFTARLARLNPGTAAWRTGPLAGTAMRRLLAVRWALTTPLDAPLPAGPPASPHRRPAPPPPPPGPASPHRRPAPVPPLPAPVPPRASSPPPPKRPPRTRPAGRSRTEARARVVKGVDVYEAGIVPCGEGARLRRRQAAPFRFPVAGVPQLRQVCSGWGG